MYALNRVNSGWLAKMSVLAMAFLFIPGDTQTRGSATLSILVPASLAGLFLLYHGLLVAAGDEAPGSSPFHRRLPGRLAALNFIPGFLSRPANFVTGFRLLLVLSGTAMASAGLSYGSLLIGVGFLLDFVDGMLARNEEPRRTSNATPEMRSRNLPRLLGPWFDAESDALALLLAGWALVAAGGASGFLLVLVGARYGFGLLFSFVPGNPPFRTWYRWYSRTAAALFQTWMALAWLAYSYQAGPSTSAFLHGPAFALTAVSIVVSFLLESAFRYAYCRSLFTAGGGGLFSSFLRYYRVPFRSRRSERLYRGFLGPGDLFFDVGAHVGGRVATMYGLGCRVVAFEPQVACVDLLEAWYGDRPEIVIVPQALGRAEGSEATVTTLDAAIARYGTPAFIKLDVEGFEAEVLEGLSEGVEACSFEFLAADKDRALRCLGLIRAFGLHEYNFSCGESFRFHFEPWLSSEETEAFIRARADGLAGGDIYARRVRHG